MEPNKILSANILDLIFDDRNKEYGAYELRITYPERIKKALLFVFLLAAIVFTGAVLANSFKPEKEGRLLAKEVTIQDIKPEEEKLPPPPEKKPEPVQVRTERLTIPQIVEDDKADTPPPTQDDLEKAVVDVKQNDGLDYTSITEPKELGDGKGIIEAKKDPVYDGPVYIVEIDAKFTGNWEKFLMRNLNGNIPVDNGAPAGRYNVIIQFVVDLEGNVSDIKPLTAHGYGMEDEAVRVLRKALKWEPAIQNGHPVKAYRKQPITFVIEEE